MSNGYEKQDLKEPDCYLIIQDNVTEETQGHRSNMNRYVAAQNLFKVLL